MIHEVIGRRIAEHRKWLGLSQAQLAEQTGLTRQTISKVERGRGDATISTLFGICRALRISPSNVFWEVGDPSVTDNIESDMLFLVAEKANARIAARWQKDRERGVPIFSMTGGEVMECPRLSLSMVNGVLEALGELGLYQFPQMVLAVSYYEDHQICGHPREAVVSSD